MDVSVQTTVPFAVAGPSAINMATCPMLWLCIVAHMIGVSTAEIDRTLYSTLNVAKDASQKQIRKAFQRLAVQRHPARQTTGVSNQDSTDYFFDIHLAFHVLRDDEYRYYYDKFGLSAVQMHQLAWIRDAVGNLSYYKNEIGVYDDSKTVKTHDNQLETLFDDTNTEFVVVLFTAADCKMCQALVPEWQQASIALQGVVSFVVYDCQLHRPTCGQFGTVGVTCCIYKVCESKCTEALIF